MLTLMMPGSGVTCSSFRRWLRGGGSLRASICIAHFWVKGLLDRRQQIQVIPDARDGGMKNTEHARLAALVSALGPAKGARIARFDAQRRAQTSVPDSK